MSQSTRHNELIVEEFTRQAAPFAQMTAHSEERSMQLLADVAALRGSDRLLDVACGPGLVACAMSPKVQHVTGIDITPAMIEQARKLQQQGGLTNMDWHVGDVTAMPFGSGSFSVVMSRYALHHILDPKAVLTEMSRVCESGGRVVVADVFSNSPAQSELYDRIEKLRDPSHVRALHIDEFRDFYAQAGLRIDRTEFYRLEMDLELLLKMTEGRSAAEVRRLLREDVGTDASGFAPQLNGSAIQISFPIIVVAGIKA